MRRILGPLPDVRPLVCDLIGHSMDPMESSYIGCSCFRCGRTFLSEAPRDDLWFWLTWYNFKGEFLMRLRWLRGHRKDEDMPF